MATWYIRVGATGNGTGPGLNQAWGTLTQAVAAGSGITGGDTVWIAPGVYRETPTFGFTNPTSTVNFFGNPTASQFPGVNPAPVRITRYTASDNLTTNTGSQINIGKDYIYLKDIVFGTFVTITGSNATVYRCTFENSSLRFQPTTTTNSNLTLDSCTSIGHTTFYFTLQRAAATYNPNVLVKNCLLIIANSASVGIRFEPTGSGDAWVTGLLLTNCTIIGGQRCIDISFAGSFPGNALLVQNCVLNSTFFGLACDIGGQIQYQNCRITGSISGPTSISGNTTTMSHMGLDFGQSKLGGIPNPQLLSNEVGSVNIGWGTTSNAPSVDLYGNTWTTSLPDAGCGAYASIGSTSFYYPTERNITNLIIAPNTTSRSETIYLGATGLTYQTSGLSASYVRTGSARVGFSLASQTVTGSWVSGGFVEIDAVNMPGMYRIDIPNAAFSSGASSVTVAIKNSNTAFGTYLSYSLQPVWIDLTQTVPYSNTVQTIGDSLNAARSSGFGKWTLNDKTLTLYGGDNTTVVKTFTLNSNTYPTERS
jgi:hypothetical protein